MTITTTVFARTVMGDKKVIYGKSVLSDGSANCRQREHLQKNQAERHCIQKKVFRCNNKKLNGSLFGI